MDKIPRLIDIAQLAEVSIGTVDRVIHKRGRVAPKTKAKVLKIAEELGYKPNIYASGLAATRTTKHILIIIPEKSKDPYWDEVHSGCKLAIDSIAQQRVKFTYLSFDLFDRLKFEKQVEELSLKGIDGLLVAPIFRKESKVLLDKIEESKKPYVIINTKTDRNSDKLICYVGPNSYQSGRLAARLMSLHCTMDAKVMIIPLDRDFKNAHHYLEKERGFRDWFSEMSPSTQVVTREFELFDNPKKLSKFLDDQLSSIENLTGIFTGSSRINRIAKYFEDKGILNIRLIGYDSVENNLMYLKKGKIDYLISQNPKLMGYMGVLNLRHFLVFKLQPEKIQYLPLDILLPENVSFHSGNFFLPDPQVFAH